MPLGRARGSMRRPMAEDLLLEIGVEELPASFVTRAVTALPAILEKQLGRLRLAHGPIWAAGTPRRLAVIAESVDARQADLDEAVIGPSVRAAFDAEGKPTRAAEAFAKKLGCSIADLERVQTPKGEYLAGRRIEKGAEAGLLLPAALQELCSSIPFQKSMRWADGETAFGRPVRWLLALLGREELAVRFAGLVARPSTHGHRFLASGEVPIQHSSEYRASLRDHHVIVDIDERRQLLLERLTSAARTVGGVLIADPALLEENCSLVEEPHVIAGQFDPAFLELPEAVILAVARGHQRYFCVRDADGRLLANYLAVVGTAEMPENIRRGNDRVMRARLADAKFFYETDRERPLGSLRAKLNQVLFHVRLGSVADKVARIERLVPLLARELRLGDQVVAVAKSAAGLCKCDLVSLMVGELPELQGEMGKAYALAQGIDPAVAAAIAEHYQPRGAEDPTAPSAPGALVAIADRLDTLVGCFAVGQIPTSTADPLALRRATLGTLRTLLDRSWDLSLERAFEHALAGFHGVSLDHSAEVTVPRLGQFFRDRLRGLLDEASDVVDACLDVDADRPVDAAQRARALGRVEPAIRESVGEVFKRAANIAKDAPEGAPVAPRLVSDTVPPAEGQLFDALDVLKHRLGAVERGQAKYETALGAIADFAPSLARYFADVFVMVEELPLRENRLRLMSDIHKTCSRFANFGLLTQRKGV